MTPVISVDSSACHVIKETFCVSFESIGKMHLLCSSKPVRPDLCLNSLDLQLPRFTAGCGQRLPHEEHAGTLHPVSSHVDILPDLLKTKHVLWDEERKSCRRPRSAGGFCHGRQSGRQDSSQGPPAAGTSEMLLRKDRSFVVEVSVCNV